MGIVKQEERKKAELEEFRRVLLSSAAVNRRKRFDGGRFPSQTTVKDEGDRDLDLPVCVTSGLSFLGVAVVDRLLSRGYSVRIIVDNPEELERVEEIQRSTNRNVTARIGRVMEQESLEEAFEDCGAVFHTSSFIDPNGFSGYTKYMVDVETRGSENVMKACGRTPSVKKCVMTSSLLACVWREPNTSSLIVNHDSWSHESLCIQNQLWYALGKLRAEKAAWRVVEANGLNMSTICPGLITGPLFSIRNSTPTFAYLKGGEDMYNVGVLATVDVNRLAEAHLRVFEAMNNRASGGRYICFDNVVQCEEEADNLAREVGIPKDRICGTGSSINAQNVRFQLSDRKLSELLSTPVRPCYNESNNY